MNASNYPEGWDAIAQEVKDAAGHKCERCGHPNDPKAGYTLTVHHLDHNPLNSARSNLAALCQRCHLHVQNIPLNALFNQLELLDPFEVHWLAKHRNESMESGKENLCQSH
jgi:5-methylcytosine-specific restriction endonuclease McrA